MLSKTQKQQIHDAFSTALDGLDGLWDKQEGAAALTGSHFSLSLLYPGKPIQRRGSTQRTDGNDLVLTRLRSILRVQVFDYEDGLSTVVDSREFHRMLNEADVVCNDIDQTFDSSFAFPEWNRVNAYDFIITWSENRRDQDGESSDDLYVEKVGVTGKFEQIQLQWFIP